MRGQLSLEGEPLSKVKSYVIKRLALRSFSTVELKNDLRKKKVSPELIGAVLEEFIHLGYLNDEAWLESFLAGSARKKRGPQAIAQKLYQKGYSQSQIEAIVSGLDQKEPLAKLMATKYRNRNLGDYKERQKVVASLCRKGFALDEILQALNP